MNHITTYAITPNALKALTGNSDLPCCIPEQWFNWTDDTNINNRVQRIVLCGTEGNGAEIIVWSKNAIAAEYSCFLIISTEDPIFIGEMDDLSDDVIPCIIDLRPYVDDVPLHSELLALLCEPEDFFVDAWSDFRGGGGRTLQDMNILPSQWWAYATELAEWIKRTAGENETSRKLRPTSLDFSTWKWSDSIAPTLLDLDCWDLTCPWTIYDIPQLENEGYVEYYPMRQMPCCGIAIDRQGQLHTIGALPTEHDGKRLWDDGTIWEFFLQRGKNFVVRDRAATEAADKIIRESRQSRESKILKKGNYGDQSLLMTNRSKKVVDLSAEKQFIISWTQGQHSYEMFLTNSSEIIICTVSPDAWKDKTTLQWGENSWFLGVSDSLEYIVLEFSTEDLGDLMGNLEDSNQETHPWIA